MPMLKLRTNMPITAEQSPNLLKAFSRLLTQETGKPERYVMIDISGNHFMLFAGSDSPLAYLECKSIGLSASQATKLSASLCQILSEELGIAGDRIYIEFSNCPAEFWGWNSSTFG